MSRGIFDWFGDDGSSEVEKARADELARQQRIRTGTTKINKLFDTTFSPNFYNQRRDSFTNFALPQLSDQTADARRELVYALDRRGALDSSSRAHQEADLEKHRALAETNIKDQGTQFANTARSNVEGARADLINTLNATGDVDASVRGATSRAAILSQVPAYSPIASLFADFTAGLGKQAAAERAFSYGAGPRPSTVTGFFGPSSSKSVVAY